MKYTRQQKKEYFRQLRAQWNEAKSLLTLEKIKAIDAIIRTHGLKISQTGFLFVSIQMKRQKLEGLPYLDAKTFRGWLDNGFRVRKGEKSTLSGITWISIGDKDAEAGDDEEIKDGYMLPKEYHLFHRSQVNAA